MYIPRKYYTNVMSTRVQHAIHTHHIYILYACPHVPCMVMESIAYTKLTLRVFATYIICPLYRGTPDIYLPTPCTYYAQLRYHTGTLRRSQPFKFLPARLPKTGRRRPQLSPYLLIQSSTRTRSQLAHNGAPRLRHANLFPPLPIANTSQNPSSHL